MVPQQIQVVVLTVQMGFHKVVLARQHVYRVHLDKTKYKMVKINVKCVQLIHLQKKVLLGQIAVIVQKVELLQSDNQVVRPVVVVDLNQVKNVIYVLKVDIKMMLISYRVIYVHLGFFKH